MLERPALSWAAIGTATTILGIVVGYFIGTSSLTSPSPASSLSKNKKNRPNSYDVDLHLDSIDEELMRSLRGDKAAKAEAETNENDDDADEEVGQDGLKVFEGKGGECKLVLIVRTDLGMNKGSSLPYFSHPYVLCMLNKPLLPQAKSPLKPPTPPYTTTKSSPRMYGFARCYDGGNPQGKRKSLCRRIQKSSLRNCRLRP